MSPPHFFPLLQYTMPPSAAYNGIFEQSYGFPLSSYHKDGTIPWNIFQSIVNMVSFELNQTLKNRHGMVCHIFGSNQSFNKRKHRYFFSIWRV